MFRSLFVMPEKEGKTGEDGGDVIMEESSTGSDDAFEDCG